MQATQLAREMVTKWGMSDSVGPVFHSSNGQVTVGAQTQDAIDKEIKMILDSSYARATKILKSNRRDLDRLAKALLEYETLTGEEVLRVMKGKAIRTHDKAKAKAAKAVGASAAGGGAADTMKSNYFASKHGYSQQGSMELDWSLRAPFCADPLPLTIPD